MTRRLFDNLRRPVTALFAATLATVVAATAAAAVPHPEIERLIVEEADLTTVPPSLALALARVESGFRDDALSHAGARGVMQIMPRTARDEYGVDPDELWDARLNVQIGIHYLESLIARYGGRWDLALSHYNGGTLHRRNGRLQPHPFTRRYVAAVLDLEKDYARQVTVWRDAKPAAPAAWHPARTRLAAVDPVAEPALAPAAAPAAAVPAPTGSAPKVQARPVTRAAPPASRRIARLRRQLPTQRSPQALDDFASGHVARTLLRRHGGAHRGRPAMPHGARSQ